jgi:hypothetical protein
MGYPTTLQNGAVVDSQRIKLLYDSWLKPLYNQEPNLVALLYFLALDPGYEMPEARRKWFIKLSFLEKGGKLDPEFRDVILSAVSVNAEESTLSIQRPEGPKK